MLVCKQRPVCCTSLLSYMLLLCCFIHQQQWAHRLFCVSKTHIRLLPHFFWDTLSPVRKSLYKHPAYLCLLLLGVLSLIRPFSSRDITAHRKFAVRQASSWLDSFFEENHGTRKYFESKWLQDVWGGTFNSMAKPLRLLKKERGCWWFTAK